jgi:hypothetical protein
MDERNNKPDENRQAMSIRSVAVEMAIKAGAGTAYNDNNQMVCNPDLIVAAAQKFEKFIKG